MWCHFQWRYIYKDPRFFTKSALLQLQYNLTKSLTSNCIRSIFYLMLNYLKLNYLITPLRYSYHFRKASIFWLMKSYILMKSLKVPILNFIYPGKVSNTKRKKQIDTNLMFNTLAFWRHDTYFVTNLLIWCYWSLSIFPWKHQEPVEVFWCV